MSRRRKRLILRLQSFQNVLWRKVSPDAVVGRKRFLLQCTMGCCLS
jgi:hypothetical protein